MNYDLFIDSLGIFSVILFIMYSLYLIYNDSPPKNTLQMSKKVENVPVEVASLADDFVLNYLMNNKPLDNIHQFLRSHGNYKGKVTKLTVENGCKIFLYAFADNSLLEITENKSVGSTTYQIKQQESEKCVG